MAQDTSSASTNSVDGLQSMLASLVDELQHPEVLWQLAVLLPIVLFAFVFARLVHRRAALAQARALANGERTRGSTTSLVSNPNSPAVDVASNLLNRLVFPVVSVALLWLAQKNFLHLPHGNVLKLAQTLLVAFGLVRLLVYALRRGFSNSGVLQAFERVIEVTVWGGVALHVTGLAAELEQLLSAIYLPIGKTQLSLLTIVHGIVSVGITMLLALWASASIESRLMKATQLDASFRAVLARFTRAVILFVAVLITLSLTGIDLTVFSVFSGALGVGLGFGMQRISSNYISGFIILLDRSIRLGDMISVDKYTGTVSQIRTRYTVIQAQDGTEAILPNELLISTPVSNFAYTDKKVRVATRVQIAYNSDIDTAMQLFVQAAMAQPRVLKDPPPKVFLIEFAADGLTLELAFWIADPEEGTTELRSLIHLQILREFGERGIEIPYPQRVLHWSMQPPPNVLDGLPNSSPIG